MKKKLIAYCDGGLGNRINTLVGALYISKLFDLELSVSWPINRWCGAPFDVLFWGDLIVDEKSMLEIDRLSKNFLLLAHERQLFNHAQLINPNKFISCKKFQRKITDQLNNFDGIVYCNSVIPMYFPLKKLCKLYSKINICQKYIELADDFMRKNCLKNYSYWGLHLRGTDANSSYFYYKFWYFITLIVPFKVVLCTDDIAIERFFLSLKNVSKREKLALPKRAIEDLGWNDTNVDEYGRNFNYNIYRNSDSIKEAIIDLLILSRSNLFYTSQSTFLDLAFQIRMHLGRDIPFWLFILKWLRFIYRKFRYN